MATTYNPLLNVLERADYVCQSLQMDTSQAHIQITEMYKSITNFNVIPLIAAAVHGYQFLVWGFIECAIMTNSDLYTDQTFDLQKFLGQKDENGQTALHKAASYGHFEVVKVLLNNVSEEHLTSYRDANGFTPLQWLKDPVYDFFIIRNLKNNAARRKVDSFVSKHDHQVIDYEELEMFPTSYPTSHKNERKLALHNLNDKKLELTPTRNTILHLVSSFGDADYTKSILKEHPSLIECRNYEGETPIYVAAREGNIDVLKILIDHVKDDKSKLELATRSMDKHTAMHIAIENHHVGVVFFLVKEIPTLANCLNIWNQSPPYLAVRRAYYHIFRLLLDKCTEIGLEWKDGEQVLHAAVFAFESPDYLQDLLLQSIDLSIYDTYGWTALHYAVSENYLYATNTLLDANPNIGYHMTKSRYVNGSAIHIAVSKGHFEQIDALLSKCPGCIEMTDSEGRNILHVAIVHSRMDVFNSILRELKTTSLINQRDSNGNTPFHLLAASDFPVPIVDYRANLYVRNNKGLTPIDMTSSEEKKRKYMKAKELAEKGKEEAERLQKIREEKEKEEKEKKEKEAEKERKKVNKIGDNVVLVITLIATATFAAAFTVPGGFDGNEGSSEQGMPILLRKAIYKVFVFSNALAFSCSCCVLFGYVRLQLHEFFFDELDEDDKEGYKNIISLQYLLTGIAMIAMAVAFITGTYVILTPSLPLAISICVTCVCIIVPFSLFPANYLGFATRFVSMFA